MAKGTVEILFLGNNKDLNAKLDSSGSKLATFAVNAGKIGALALVAAGAGLVKLGTSLDSALDNIIIGTGATGDALAGLKTSFENVASSVPNSFGDVSTAIADVNTRLGLTGAPLEALTTQFLDLSRMTGTDVSTNIANMTRVMGDAGIATEDQGAALDMLFKASQTSGIGLDQLSTSLVSFGAPMRALGFSFEESTALLSKFELEGVNTEAVMAGMKQGLGRMAKAGEEPIDTFDRIVESIASAGTAGEANAIALEAFGQRAGPDMAAAIREGRFEIDDMMAALSDSEGAISDTADATESWTEKLKILANKAMIKIAPLAEKAFGAIETAVAAATPFVESIVDWISNKVPPAIDAAKRAFDRIAPIIEGAFRWIMDNKTVVLAAFTGIGVVAVAMFTSWAISAGAAAVATLVLWAPIAALVVGIGALAAGIVWAYQNVDWFREAVDKVWQVIQTGFNVAVDAATVAIDFLWGAIKTAASWLADMWDKTENLRALAAAGFKVALDNARTAIDFVWGAIKTAASWLQTAWDKTDTLRSLYASGFKVALDAVRTAVDFVWGALLTAASWLKTAWDKTESLRALFVNGFGLALDATLLALDGVWGAVQTVASWLQSAWTKTENLRAILVAGFKTALENATTAFNTMWDAIQKVASWLQSAWTKSENLRAILEGGLKDGLNTVKGVFNNLKTAVEAVATSIQKVINKANDAISLVRSIPGLGGGPSGSIASGGFTIEEKKHSGGFIGNPSGPRRDIPIMGQQGEFVLSSDDVQLLMSGVGSLGGGGTPVHIHLADHRTIVGMFDAHDAELLATLEGGVRG